MIYLNSTWVDAGLSASCTFLNPKFGNALCHGSGHASHLFNVFNELWKREHRSGKGDCIISTFHLVHNDIYLTKVILTALFSCISWLRFRHKIHNRIPNQCSIDHKIVVFYLRNTAPLPHRSGASLCMCSVAQQPSVLIVIYYSWGVINQSGHWARPAVSQL